MEIDKVESLMNDVCDNLDAIWKYTNEPESFSKPELKLNFAKQRDHNKTEYNQKLIRVSEQEARFCTCAVLEKRNYPWQYSVEYPAENNYFNFSKGMKEMYVEPAKASDNHRAAQIDLVLLEEGSIAWNIEFKYGNDKDKIAKDILKLLNERSNGVFVNILEKKGTGKSLRVDRENNCLFDKYEEILDEFKNKGLSGKLRWPENQGDKMIGFVVIVLGSPKQKAYHWCKFVKQDDLRKYNKYDFFPKVDPFSNRA
jgi:hypothetical protein